MHHDWPVEEAIINLPIKMKGNLKHTSGDLKSLLRAQSNDISTASQMLLTNVKLHLWCKLGVLGGQSFAEEART